MNFNRIFSKNGLDELFIKLYLIVVCGGCLSKMYISPYGPTGKQASILFWKCWTHSAISQLACVM